MSNTFVVRYEMRPETADENQRLVEQVFTELSDKQPEGLRYASFRLADGVTFVHIGISEEDAAPLGELGAFAEFQRQFGERAAGKPEASGATVIGSFGFLPE
ncbi:hypothetical protein [Amycolatopsis palatopharyngis]|uniref:hypothetical protein n=1 Tax=Amycolatopsis palatopharyngis TaxID=187982 RepID=UPI000E275E6F|nr:hypothetical protein [Amycolatopsis palatopharyngis]